MKKIYICVLSIFISATASAQTESQNDYLKKILTSNKVDITKQSVTKTLSDPAHWIMLASYYDSSLQVANIYTSYKFITDGVFYRASPTVYRASDIPAWLWSYQNSNRELKIITQSDTSVYKVFVLNAVEMVLEDSDGGRLYLSAKTDYESAPRPLGWKMRFTTIPTASSLKDEWKVK